MAGNGEKLEAMEKAIEKALTSRPAPGPVQGPRGQAPEGDDMVARLDAAISACRALGHEGYVIDEMSKAFADHLEKLLGEYHSRIKERMAELDRMIGRLGKRGNTPSAS